MIGNKFADKITNISRNLQKNNSETVTNENEKEIPKERYISPEKRKKMYWWLEIKTVVQKWNIKN